MDNSQMTDHANFCTNVRLNNITFAHVDILNILKNLDINKVNGNDNLSIRTIKLCSDSICKPHDLYFQPV